MSSICSPIFLPFDSLTLLARLMMLRIGSERVTAVSEA